MLTSKIKISFSTAFMVIGAMLNQSKINSFWDSIPNKQVAYLYAPGLFGSEFIMSRYCPEFMAMTGEKITCVKGGHVIGQPHKSVVFNDVNLNKPKNSSWHPVTVLVNKFRSSVFPRAESFFDDKYGIKIADNPTSQLSVVNYFPKLASSDIGQQNDINILSQAYFELVSQYPDLDIVLYGDSRGAATSFNFLALNRPSQVRAAVLEGIFDTVPHCIKHFIHDHKSSITEESLHYVLAKLTGKYRKDGINPLKSADLIDDHVPILFVASLKDGVVPAQSSLNLYKKLKNRGHKQVHLLILQKSLHPIYMLDDLDDKIAYETVVHAFYKHYNLPHNAQKAAQGQDLFANTQPEIQDLAQLYPVSTCELC